MRAFRASGLLLLLILAGCAVQKPPKPIEKVERETLIRVGLVWNTPSVEFFVNNNFQITSHDGTVIAKGMKGNRWRAEVKTSVPGKTVYRLVAASMSSMENAEAMQEKLERMGLDTDIQPVGQTLRIGGRQIHDNRFYRVCLKPLFEKKQDAEVYRDALWNRLETFIVQQQVEKASGILRLINLENGQQFESSKSILIKGSSVTLVQVPVGDGYHWEGSENRSYPETVAFTIGNDGKLTAINMLPLEKYLEGVVPSEMPSGFPLEALKAQAVAARGEALASWGFSHEADPFDLCSDVHCQVYSGLSKKAPSTDQAVRETRGLVLWQDDRICNTVYSAVCGGHTEDVDRVWGGQAKPYLRGNYDGPGGLKGYGDLSNEKNLRRWINANPPAFCNTAQGWILPALEYTKKYFRWEVRYTQNELKTLLFEKTGRNLGLILDLVALERGASGRMIRLKIVGTEDVWIVEGELNIRKTLSSNTLWSSCFYVEKKENAEKVPEEFLLKGAGFGHGVGMCQTGAAVMALQGKRFDHILKHYYKEATIRRLY